MLSLSATLDNVVDVGPYRFCCAECEASGVRVALLLDRAEVSYKQAFCFLLACQTRSVPCEITLRCRELNPKISQLTCSCIVEAQGHDVQHSMQSLRQRSLHYQSDIWGCILDMNSRFTVAWCLQLVSRYCSCYRCEGGAVSCSPSSSMPVHIGKQLVRRLTNLMYCRLTASG
jgi:hypothetical protein